MSDDLIFPVLLTSPIPSQKVLSVITRASLSYFDASFLPVYKSALQQFLASENLERFFSDKINSCLKGALRSVNLTVLY